MPVKPEFEPHNLYFVTTCAENHAHLFAPAWARQVILDSFHFLQTTGRMDLYAFVIMPNHVHFVARFGTAHSLSDVMRDFKRHTARQLIQRFRAENSRHILAVMRKASRVRDQEYKVWEDGYDARDVFTSEFLEQKLNYLHHNPCQEHWKLSELPEDYPWSSAGYYLADRPCAIPINDVRDLL